MLFSKIFAGLLFAISFIDAIESYDRDLESCSIASQIGQDLLFISLGSSCEVAHQLRHLRLRSVAFPLDWILSVDNSKLIILLNNNFQDFFCPEYLQINNGFLIHSYYSLVFPHEGNWQELFYWETLEKFKVKFQRRIDRFQELSSFQGKVFFIRAAWPYANNCETVYRDKENLEISDVSAEQLYQVLRNRFPLLDFILIVENICNGTEVIVEPISVNIIKIHYNPLLEPAQKLELCKKTFIKLLQNCNCSHYPIFTDLVNSQPFF